MTYTAGMLFLWNKPLYLKKCKDYDNTIGAEQHSEHCCFIELDPFMNHTLYLQSHYHQFHSFHLYDVMVSHDTKTPLLNFADFFLNV